MYFALLGPLQVRSADGADVAPSGGLLRTLLVTLLASANRPVPVDTLTDVLWPDDVSGRAAAKLHLAVHRLRSALDRPDRVVRIGDGYQIGVASDEYDVARLDAAVAHLQVEDLAPTESARVAREAHLLWRGRPLFDGLDHHVVAPEVARCQARRHVLLELWCEASIACGRPDDVVPELEAVAAESPTQERVHALLMRALRASGRTADALTVFARARQALADGLGVDPGAELTREHASALAGEGRPTQPVPAQLPPRPAGVRGRDASLAAIDAAFSETGSRMAIVTGAAGVGKTATAVEWAHRHIEDFPDGQLYIDLRGFSDDDPVAPDDALAEFLPALGIDRGAMPSDRDSRSAMFRSVLAGRRVLLVLDNAATVDQVRPLLPGSEGCAVLVTSRASLPGLSVRDGARQVGLEPLSQEASVEIVTDVLGNLEADDAEAVRILARWCGNLPLTLRIAAQQVASHPSGSVSAVVAGVVDELAPLDLLDVGDGPATDIRSVLSWSVTALPSDTARVFRYLGLIPGPDADEAALVALCGVDRRALRSHLRAIERAHLVERTTPDRYRQHDVLRAYAAELAREVDDADDRRAARRRLLEFYASVAARADGDPHAVEEWMSAECENVLAAVGGAGATVAEVSKLAGSFEHFLRVSGRDDAGRRLHARHLELAQAAGDLSGEDRARMALGNLAHRRGDWEDAEAAYHAVIALSEKTGRRDRWAAATGNLGGLALDRGELGQAVEHLTAALEVFQDHEDMSGVTITLCRLGDCRLLAGDAPAARELYDEALRICDRSGADIARGEALVGLADADVVLGDLDAAESAAATAHDIAHRHSEDEPLAMSAMAAVRMARGQHVEADELITVALRDARRLGAADVTMSVLRRYVAATPSSDGAALREVAVAFADKHGFHAVARSLRAGASDR